MTLSQSIPVSGPMIPVVVITFVFIGSLIAGMVMLALRGGRTGKVIAATLAAFIAALCLRCFYASTSSGPTRERWYPSPA